MQATNSPKRPTGNFDWGKLRQRISEVDEALTKLDEVSPQMLEKIWSERAIKLARAPMAEESGELIDLVLIRLGREIFGLDSHYVWDIQAVKQITRVPRVPPWVAGVVNLRGRIYSVVDLQRFFNLPGPEKTADKHATRSSTTAGKAEAIPYLVVVETPEMELALMVSEVLSIEAVPADSLQDATGTVRGLRSEYVRGVTEYKSGNWWDASAHIVVLDLPVLLADPNLIIHEEII